MRAGLWPFRTGFGMFAAALIAGLAAAVALVVPRLRAGALRVLLCSLLLGLAAVAVPLDHIRRVLPLELAETPARVRAGTRRRRTARLGNRSGG